MDKLGPYANMRDGDLVQYRRAHRFTLGLVLAGVAVGMALAVWVLTMGGV